MNLNGPSNHAGGQRIPDKYPIKDKLPEGMHEKADAYADQQAHDDYWDGLSYDTYDPRD